MTNPRTRLDKVVQLRTRAEDDAAAGLARARAVVERARQTLDRAIDAARQDARRTGPVELWQIDDLAHRRALQAVRSAQGEVQRAVHGEAKALQGWSAARQEKRVVERAQERRRGEILQEMDRRERRDVDELVMMRHNHAEASASADGARRGSGRGGEGGGGGR